MRFNDLMTTTRNPTPYQLERSARIPFWNAQNALRDLEEETLDEALIAPLAAEVAATGAVWAEAFLAYCAATGEYDEATARLHVEKMTARR